MSSKAPEFFKLGAFFVGSACTVLASPSPIFVVDFAAYSSIINDLETAVKSMFSSPQAVLAYMPRPILITLYLSSINVMRMSELLNVRPADYISDGRFIVRGLKRSRSYVVSILVKQYRDLISSDPSFLLPIFPFTYKRVYTWCVRCRLGFTGTDRQNISRTHAHRYLTAGKVAGLADRRGAGDVLHHRTESAVHYYLNEKGSVYGKDS